MSSKLIVKRRGRPIAQPELKKVIRKEIKSYDNKTTEKNEEFMTPTSMGINSVGYGSSAQALQVCRTFITQGTNDTDRIGNELYLKSLVFRFTAEPGDTYNNLRLLFVMSKGDVPASATVAQLIADIFGGATSSATQWDSLINTEKYRVLYDKSVFLEKFPTDGNSSSVHPRAKYLTGKIKINQKIRWMYDGESTLVLPFRDIICVAISDSAAVPNPGFVSGAMRLRWTDK